MNFAPKKRKENGGKSGGGVLEIVDPSSQMIGKDVKRTKSSDNGKKTAFQERSTVGNIIVRKVLGWVVWIKSDQINIGLSNTKIPIKLKPKVNKTVSKLKVLDILQNLVLWIRL